MSLTARIDRSSWRSSAMPNPAARFGSTTRPWATAHSSTGVVGSPASSGATSASIVVRPSPQSYRTPTADSLTAMAEPVHRDLQLARGGRLRRWWFHVLQVDEDRALALASLADLDGIPRELLGLEVV